MLSRFRRQTFPFVGFISGFISGFIVFFFTRFVLDVPWPETCIFWTPVLGAIIGMLFGYYYSELKEDMLPTTRLLLLGILALFLLYYVLDPTRFFGHFGVNIDPSDTYNQYIVGVSAGLFTGAILPFIKEG